MMSLKKKIDERQRISFDECLGSCRATFLPQAKQSARHKLVLAGFTFVDQGTEGSAGEIRGQR